jgi:drug/metabolite transporter (DMT)-like permease
MLRFCIPALFVLIWSTGFIAARTALPHSDLQLFILCRLSLTALLMAVLARIAGASWPRGRQIGYQIGTGALLLGIYLCFSYWSMTHGMAAGVMALLGALQPLFTALFTVVTGERLSARVWSGLVIGFAGVACVLAPKLTHGTQGLPLMAVVAALIGVLGITAGSLLQKKLAPVDLRSASSIQNIGGAAVALLMTLFASSPHWDDSFPLWGALFYSIGVASIIGTTLLMWMLRNGDATRVTALILLAPPLAALQAYFFFHETLTSIQFVGFALALGGVLLARSTQIAATNVRKA